MEGKESSIRAPRLLTIPRGPKGYGFNLHGERGIVGQFISAVDDGGPADEAGLCIGDRVVEVNSVNVEAATHSQVVAKIKEVHEETVVLVVDKVTDDYMKQHDIRVLAEFAKLDTVTSLIKEEESGAKVEIEPEEEPKTEAAADDVSGAADSGETVGDEPEEVGVSVEDYLASLEVDDKPVADAQEGAASAEGEKVESAAEIVVETKEEIVVEANEEIVVEAKEEIVVESSPVEIEETEQREETVKPAHPGIAPPDVPPPSPPTEQAAEPVQAEAPVPVSEPEPVAVPEVAKEPEQAAAPEPAKEPEQAAAPEPAKEPEQAAAPEPAKEAEQAAAPEPTDKETQDAPPSYQQSESGYKIKSLSLPKPKRKEIKEKKGSDWASKAAMFNNL